MKRFPVVVFSFFLLSLVGPVFTANASYVEDFPEREKKLILQFRQFARENQLKQARKLIKRIQKQLASKELDPNFKVADLFTAYFYTEYASPGRFESLLSEYCRYSHDVSFFEEMLNLIAGNPDDYPRPDGMTPLMLYAKYPSEYTGECVEALIKKGSNPTQVNRVSERTGFGDFDALSYALIEHNEPVIKIFLKHIQEKPRKLRWINEEFLRAYQGEEFDSEDLLGMHRYRLFRVANQSLNFKMVDRMRKNFPIPFEEGARKEILAWENHEKVQKARGNFYYPPLWLYNAVELRQYAQQIIEELKPHVIDQAALRPLDQKGDFYSYLHGHENLTLLKKNIKPLAGRILALHHLEKSGTGYGLPRKFITVPEGSLEKSKVTITLPPESGVYKNRLETPSGLNKVNIEIEGIELYVEYIAGQHVNIRPFGGFEDGSGNGIKREVDDRTFIIDTGDDKNFIVPIGDSSQAYEGKSLHFAPHIRQITIDLGAQFK